MRLLRIAGAVAAGLLVLALLAAWLAPRELDWNRYRDTIATVASTTLGRPVQITGPVSLTLLPHPVLTAAGVMVTDAGDGASAAVAELRLQVAMLPLLAGRLEVQDLTLQDARIRLPWPFRPGALQQPPPSWVMGLRARVEDGTLLIGGLKVADVAGTLSVDPLTGTFSMDGLAAALGRRWRVTARLGRDGGDGSAPLEVSLDDQDPARDTGGTLSGQIAPDGSLVGRVTGRGRDLSRLIPGPAVPWHAAGRFRGGDGLALADQLDVEIGGVPARGAVALRLLPEARLDVAFATSRLDLGAWLPNLLAGGGMTLPTSVDLSAEAAALAGGTLRHLRAAFDIAPNGVGVRDAEAVLPGDATLAVAGRLAAGRFTGTGRLTAPTLRETLHWLQPLAPTIVDALPPDVLQTANLAADVVIAAGAVDLTSLKGTIDGSAAGGTLDLQPGGHGALRGSLQLADVNLDPWLPTLTATLPRLAMALSGWPGRWGQLDLALALAVDRPRWQGQTLDRLDLDAALHDGTLTVRRAALTGPNFGAELSGSLAPGGRLTDGWIKAHVDHAAALASRMTPDWLSRDWPSLDWPATLLKGPAMLQAKAAGLPNALGLAVQAVIADLNVNATGTADLPGPGWTGTLDLRHPGAPRLLEALGLPGVASWLGDGSFSLATDLAATAGHVALSGFNVSAGMLRATGDLMLDRGGGADHKLPPMLTGQIAAETLPLPLPYARSPEPLPLGALRGWHAQLGVKAAHVLFGLSPGLDDAAASVSLADGTLRLAGLTGQVAGGKLTGQAELDAAMPPKLSMQGDLSGAALSGSLLDGTLDVTAGRLDASLSLQASGYSPGGLLATLQGDAHVAVSDGVLSGIDLAAVDTALDQQDAVSVQAGVARGLDGGSTAFSRLSVDLLARHGAVTLRQGVLSAPAGAATLTGTVDLPIDSANLTVTLAPTHPAAPAIGLRLIGPAASPRRTPELAKLTGWLAER